MQRYPSPSFLVQSSAVQISVTQTDEEQFLLFLLRGNRTLPLSLRNHFLNSQKIFIRRRSQQQQQHDTKKNLTTIRLFVSLNGLRLALEQRKARFKVKEKKANVVVVGHISSDFSLFRRSSRVIYSFMSRIGWPYGTYVTLFGMVNARNLAPNRAEMKKEIGKTRKINTQRSTQAANAKSNRIHHVKICFSFRSTHFGLVSMSPSVPSAPHTVTAESHIHAIALHLALAQPL